MFRLADQYGAVLAGRGEAREIREEIERLAATAAEVVVDLNGVVTMSPSFADELFGKLPANVGDRVRFEHLNGHLSAVADLARRTRAAR